MKYRHTIILLMLILLTGCSFKTSETQPIIVNEDLPKIQVWYYLPVNQDSENFNKILVPAGSLLLSCDNYITLQKGGYVRSADQADALLSALSQTLTSVPDKNSIYYNPILENSNIKLESIDYNLDGKLDIKLTGSFVENNKCQQILQKSMIYHTINQNFEINNVNVYLDNSVIIW